MKKYFYVYVLKSLKDGMFYTGYTNDLNKRFSEHNSGKVLNTKKRIPINLVCWEGCLNQQDAATREKYLKTAWDEIH